MSAIEWAFETALDGIVDLDGPPPTRQAFTRPIPRTNTSTNNPSPTRWYVFLLKDLARARFYVGKSNDLESCATVIGFGGYAALDLDVSCYVTLQSEKAASDFECVLRRKFGPYRFDKRVKASENTEWFRAVAYHGCRAFVGEYGDLHACSPLKKFPNRFIELIGGPLDNAENDGI